MKIIMNNVSITNKVQVEYQLVKNVTINLSQTNDGTIIPDSGIDEAGTYKFIINSDHRVYFIGFRGAYNSVIYWFKPQFKKYIEPNTNIEYFAEISKEEVNNFVHSTEFVLPAADTNNTSVTIKIYKAK